MATSVLAAGVLGVAGWGIWRRSQAVGGEADAIPLPPALENTSRAHVVAAVNSATGPTGPLANMADLSTFYSVTNWGDGAVVVPAGHEADVAKIAGAEWQYARLIQASSLNMMALINDAQARSATPVIPDSQIGTAASFFNLASARPLKANPGIDAQIKAVEKYLRQKVPLPTKPQ